NGRYALSGSADRTLKIWEVATGRCLACCEGHTDVVTSVAWSPDGRFALSGGADWTLKFWEAATGRCLGTLESHTDPVHAVFVSADGRLALSGSAQFLTRNQNERLFTSGQCKLWDLASGRCLPTFAEQTEAVTAVCLSADGRLALTGGGQ